MKSKIFENVETSAGQKIIGLARMKLPRLLLFMLVGLSLSLVGYEKPAQASVTSDAVTQNVAQAAGGATRAEQERDEYIRKAQREIDEARAELDKLRVKAQTARDEAKAKLDSEIKALNEKWKATEQKLSELKSANVKAWKRLKAGMDSALEDLKQSFAKAKKEFE